MFVGSYSTYIDTATTKNTPHRRVDDAKKSSDVSFRNKLQTLESGTLVATQKLPINYISNYKALYNRQQMQHQELTNNRAKTTFDKVSAMGKAQVAYRENATTFSLFIKPKITLTPVPKELPKTKASPIKQAMINTYIANENYYKITAA